MTSSELIEQWKRDEAAVFEGWDFSYLKDRASQEEPPWSYRDRAIELLSTARHVLDIDTGGGEQLLSFAALTPGTRAIESYHLNVAVARERLAPRGVEVEEVPVGARFPFADATFDLILNRHGHLNTPEIARTLQPGGIFFTQQVEAGNLADLIELFGVSVPPGDNTLAGVTAQLETAGLTLKRAETWTGQQSFKDVGALAYFLRAVPWVVPGFTVDSYREVLERLQEQLQGTGRLAFSITRFLIEAVKTPITGSLTAPRKTPL